jgi:class 3 adenylate cyclase
VASEPVGRKLAAILAVDVAGYSRLMGEDETGTAHAVREHREAVRPIVTTHGGRIVKTMGDGVLLEFPSVVAAVECAIAVQKLMVERNASVPENKRILYRIGVNLGDVLIENEDILGDGVNIAARLEGIAEPGRLHANSSKKNDLGNLAIEVGSDKHLCNQYGVTLVNPAEYPGVRSRPAIHRPPNLSYLIKGLTLSCGMRQNSELHSRPFALLDH